MQQIEIDYFVYSNCYSS